MDNTEGQPALRHWLSRWVKALIAAVLSLVAVGIGVSLKPPKPLARDIVQPTVTIFASQPHVTAVVTMSAYPYPAAPSPSAAATGSTTTPGTGTGATGTPAPPAPGYELDIALKVLSPRSSAVTFVLLLGDFPRILSTGITGLIAAPTIPPASALSGVLPVPGQDAAGHADYLAFRDFVPATSAAARAKRPSEPTVKIATQYSVVSRSSGSELQLAFPVVLDEKAASSPLPTESFAISSLLGAYQNRPTEFSAYPPAYYAPSLEPADIQYRPDSSTNLADYQTLAGNAPVTRPAGAWAWAGIGNVSLFAQDALTADVDQEHLFWDGVAWGVAGAGGIAAVLELVSAIQGEQAARRRRARTRDLPAGGEPASDGGSGNGLPAGVSPGGGESDQLTA